MWENFKNKFNFENVGNVIIQKGNISVQNLNGRSKATISGDVSEIEVQLIVDGNVVSVPLGSGILIEVHGNVGQVKTDVGDVEVHGNSGNVSSKTGNVNVKGNVSGNAESNTGNINAKDVGGDAESKTGNIRAETIRGNCRTTMGNIYKN